MRELSHHDENPYDKNPFYAKYLNTGSPLDAEMQRVLNDLRANPDSAELHNDLGAMLVEKGFPHDAEVEFERSINANGKYVPAWYNLGLVRAANGDALGARRALIKTVSLKPGHSAALFQLGLIEEKRQHSDRAIELYAKAFTINPALMAVDVNPRVLDSKLMDLALLRMYKTSHTKESLQFQDAPSFVGVPAASGSSTPRASDAPSPQPAPRNIVTPSAPPTDPGTQLNPQSSETTQPARRRRPRTPATTDQPQTEQIPQPAPQNPPVE
jgi:tetratricopeptide (TPR) repeat protein